MTFYQLAGSSPAKRLRLNEAAFNLAELFFSVSAVQSIVLSRKSASARDFGALQGRKAETFARGTHFWTSQTSITQLKRNPVRDKDLGTS